MLAFFIPRLAFFVAAFGVGGCVDRERTGAHRRNTGARRQRAKNIATRNGRFLFLLHRRLHRPLRRPLWFPGVQAPIRQPNSSRLYLLSQHPPPPPTPPAYAPHRPPLSANHL